MKKSNVKIDVIIGVSFAVLVALILWLFGFSVADGANGKKVFSISMWTATDLTSPDGVHYWLHSNEHGEMLVPRYDKDGKIMVDEQ